MRRQARVNLMGGSLELTWRTIICLYPIHGYGLLGLGGFLPSPAPAWCVCDDDFDIREYGKAGEGEWKGEPWAMSHSSHKNPPQVRVSQGQTQPPFHCCGRFSSSKGILYSTCILCTKGVAVSFLHHRENTVFSFTFKEPAKSISQPSDLSIVSDWLSPSHLRGCWVPLFIFFSLLLCSPAKAERQQQASSDERNAPIILNLSPVTIYSFFAAFHSN